MIVIAMWATSEIMGYAGAALVLYSAWSAYTGEAFGPVERWAPRVSALLTLVGTTLTALSVYVPSTLRPAWRSSSYFVTPVVVIAGTIAFYILISRGALPNTFVSGFALLGIAGALKRLLPYPVDARFDAYRSRRFPN